MTDETDDETDDDLHVDAILAFDPANERHIHSHTSHVFDPVAQLSINLRNFMWWVGECTVKDASPIGVIVHGTNQEVYEVPRPIEDAAIRVLDVTHRLRNLSTLPSVATNKNPRYMASTELADIALSHLSHAPPGTREAIRRALDDLALIIDVLYALLAINRTRDIGLDDYTDERVQAFEAALGLIHISDMT